MKIRRRTPAIALAATLVTAGAFLPATHALADANGAYLHDGSISTSAPNWMAQIPDNTRLSELSIPGTHDTMANGPGGVTTQTQSLNLTTQLNAGIRFIDIRLLKNPNDNQLYVYHGPVFQNATIDDVLTAASRFLAANPTETLLMRTKQEWSNQPLNEFSNALRSHLEPYAQQLWANDGQGVQTELHATRGKLALLTEDIPHLPWGIPYGEASSIQDNYNLTSNASLYRKWTDVKDQLTAANTAHKNPDEHPLYMNYLSGSGGSFPYFVASGKSGPGTHAPQLSTGLTTPAFKNTYPDFPRTSCFIGICTISFQGTNQLTANHLTTTAPEFVGIIIADFPGPALIEAVIAANKH